MKFTKDERDLVFDIVLARYRKNKLNLTVISEEKFPVYHEKLQKETNMLLNIMDKLHDN